MGQTCGANHPLKCRVRAKAMDEGKVWYDYHNATWWWDWGGYPLPVSHCAGCGCPLPVMGQIVKRVIRGDTPWDATLGNPEE